MNRMASVHASSRGLTVFRLGVLSLLVVLTGFLLASGCGGEEPEPIVHPIAGDCHARSHADCPPTAAPAANGNERAHRSASPSR